VNPGTEVSVSLRVGKGQPPQRSRGRRVAPTWWTRWSHRARGRIHARSPTDRTKCRHNQVSRLVAGPGVYICNECIELCIEIIEEELSEASGLQVEEPPTPKRQIDPRTFTEQELQALKLLSEGASAEKIAQEVDPDILGQTLAKVWELRREERPDDPDLE
jgi:hypothetical protein